MTIQEVIQNNNWTSIAFEKSTAVNRLFNSGILGRAGEQAQKILDAIDYDNVQSVITVGIVNSEFEEQNLGDATDNEAGAIEPTFGEVNVKTFYGNKWWKVRTIQRDLLNASKPITLVGEKVGAYWAEQLNKIISATVSGMADITGITIGDGTANLSRQMVIDARKLKKDMGVGKLANAYMSSTTLFDILGKQEAGTITSEVISETYGMVEIVENGVRKMVQSDTPEYKLMGVTKIVVDDTMKDGVISLVEDGAFAFEQKNIKKPLMYNHNPKAGNGAGSEEWGTKALYICHPVGFSFKGVLGTDYANKSGLTLAELQGGGLYELKTDPKLAKITNLKVKIG